MADAYSIDLRERVVAAYESGVGSQSKIARIFSITTRTLQNYLYRKRTAGTLLPSAAKRGRKASINPEGLAAIDSWIEERSDITLRELCDKYYKKFKVPTSESMMHRACQQLKLSFKKKSLRASEQERADIKKSVHNLSKP